MKPQHFWYWRKGFTTWHIPDTVVQVNLTLCGHQLNPPFIASNTVPEDLRCRVCTAVNERGR